MQRREFLRRLMSLMATGAAASSLSRASGAGQDAGETPASGAQASPPSDRGEAPETTPRLPLRVFGSTGLSLPVLGLGGYHLGQARSEAAGRRLVDVALEEGIRFFDSAEQYQRGQGSLSERYLGAALEDVRDEVFLMTKTYAPDVRSAESAREHLEASLERLRTDRLDLWQLHSIKTVEDVERAFAPGGAMEAILEARQAGRVRFIGVTGHARPEAHLRALRFWDEGLRFDAVQMPLNPMDRHQLSFALEVLPELERRGLAVIAMKTAAGGSLLQEGLCSVEECLRYALSLPTDIVVSGMETVAQVRANAAVVRSAEPLGEAELAALLDRIEPRTALELESYKQA